MKTFLEYVDEAQEKLGIESDAGLSKHLGGGDNRTLVSNWRNKGVVPEDYYCILIAEALDIDPLEVIAAANYARSKDDERKAFWENFAKQHVKTVAGVLLGLAVFFGGFSAAASAEKAALVVAVFVLFQVRIMYIMLSWKKRLFSASHTIPHTRHTCALCVITF